jgi:hypothetical protein
MDVFISWSGERSQILARALADLLPDAIQDLRAWMSEHDISAGSRWGHALHQQLESSNFGVLCLTPENINAAWLLFEAGSLAKSVSGGRVVPYRLNLNAVDVPFPLAQFQGVDADALGTKKLLASLNAVRKQPIDSGRLDRVFERWWPDLEARIRAIPVSPNEQQPRIGERPANMFWLGHDLARAIRLTMFETSNRDELDQELIQALHHLDQVGLGAPDARQLLLQAIKTHRHRPDLSEVERREFVNRVCRVTEIVEAGRL